LKKFLFVDLDDTLFQTPKKCREQSGLQPVAYLKDGSACSFSTARQRAFFDFAQRDMTLIPATARNHEAFSRVDLPFSSYAIIDYGGVILHPNGQPDPAWQEQIQNHMQLALPGLHAVREQIDHYISQHGLAGRARLVEDYGTAFYTLIKDPDGKAENLQQIEEQLLRPWLASTGQDFYLHRNANNLAVLPNTLNKAHAVRYLSTLLQQEYGEIIRFGMGDSRSDAHFMAACDYAIIPANTQLASHLLTANTVNAMSTVGSLVEELT
jgi:hydroxymethylpyrimidine pyrophosphatase-like HAD family hydrolase